MLPLVDISSTIITFSKNDIERNKKCRIDRNYKNGAIKRIVGYGTRNWIIGSRVVKALSL